MDATVVIPARNAERLISEQLSALRQQDYEGPFEVIVVDNASTDRTQAAVQSFIRSGMQNLRLLTANDRTGVNYVRNVGARAARGRVVLFCDADDVVYPGWVRAMVETLKDHAGAGGRVETYSLNPQHLSAVRHPDSYRLTPMMDFLPRAPGCSCGVRKDVYDELGGFDESYAYGGEDDEFFWRLQLAGHSVGFAEEAVVAYRLRPGLWPTLRQVYSYSRAKPKLYRDFRVHGIERSYVAMAKGWGWLVTHMPDLVRSQERRYNWLRVASIRAGTLAGSIRYRVVYL